MTFNFNFLLLYFFFTSVLSFHLKISLFTQPNSLKKDHLSSVIGPKLPHACIDGSMVSSSNGQESFLVGCEENSEKIYKLRWSHDLWSNVTTLEWLLMKQKLKYPKHQAVAMLIPDELTQCTYLGRFFYRS